MVQRILAFVRFDDDRAAEEGDYAEDLEGVVDFCTEGFVARCGFGCWLED